VFKVQTHRPDGDNHGMRHSLTGTPSVGPFLMFTSGTCYLPHATTHAHIHVTKARTTARTAMMKRTSLPPARGAYLRALNSTNSSYPCRRLAALAPSDVGIADLHFFTRAGRLSQTSRRLRAPVRPPGVTTNDVIERHQGNRQAHCARGAGNLE
jgi:hypothetical protein